MTLILDQPWRLDILNAIAGLGLPDCWIGAGFLRTPVWNQLHGFAGDKPQGDLDVIYFDPDNLDWRQDLVLEKRLKMLLPQAEGVALDWSVRNQARMHWRNGDPAYQSTEDALRHWLEVPTAVALRLGVAAPTQTELLAPFGLEDLFALRLRPTPHARRHRLAAYQARLKAKDWLRRWPRLIVDWGD